jgi:hypothetical protein
MNKWPWYWSLLPRVYNFLSPMTTVYQLWYIREASVAIQVGNLICCWQLMQKLFKIRSFDNKSDQIVAQPEMTGRHNQQHPSQYSVGGSPKTSSWFAKQRQKMEFLGEWSRICQAVLTKSSRSYASQPSHHKDTKTSISTMTDQTPVNSPATATTCMAPTPLMTLNHYGDDAGPAIAYCHQENIVWLGWSICFEQFWHLRVGNLFLLFYEAYGNESEGLKDWSKPDSKVINGYIYMERILPCETLSSPVNILLLMPDLLL